MHCHWKRLTATLQKVMENKKLDGYVTEKIINAYFSGCVPIWYGSDTIFEIFNPKSFIFYNVSNSGELALREIARLEGNKTAYMEVTQKESILLEGIATIDKFFAFGDDILPNATLKRNVRKMLLTTGQRTC